MAVRVPYLGPIKPLRTSGPQVVYAKRALKQSGFYNGRTSGIGAGYAGPVFAAALKRFALATVVPKTDGKGSVVAGHRSAARLAWTGSYGPHLHVKLAPFYDAYGASMLSAMLRLRRIAAVQAAGVAAMRLVIANEPRIHYTQGFGRMMGVTQALVPPRFPTEADCSAMDTWIKYVMHRCAQTFGGSFPDPNGLDYNGYGYTGTEIQHGRRVDWRAGARAFTSLFYGRGVISHVTTKLTATTCESHGWEGDPSENPCLYRSDYQFAIQYSPVIP